MSRPSVSVVMPARNAERYIGEAIESLLVQEPALAEVIVVVDDRSTDGSEKIAKSFGPPVRVLASTQSTIGKGRNVGCEAASGEVLGMLDADDLWTPRALASRLPLFARSPTPDIVWGRVRHFLSPELDPETVGRPHVPEGTAPAHLPGGMLVTRAAFDRVGPFAEDLRAGELTEWIGRARDAGVVEAATDEVVLLRRMHDENFTMRNRESLTDHARALKLGLDRRRAAAQRQR
jgi:glycosyltransferase involved in cell wall biosynthesis